MKLKSFQLGITHGDIKLENMLVNTIDEEGSIPIVKHSLGNHQFLI